MEKEFLEFIANVMNIDVNKISLDTTYGECEAWDSVMFLTMILEIEEKYHVQIPIEKAIELKSLKEIYQFILKKME